MLKDQQRGFRFGLENDANVPQWANQKSLLASLSMECCLRQRFPVLL